VSFASNGRGRPRYVADIDNTEDKALFLYDSFYEACRNLSYRDCVALSRKYKVSLRAVYAWRNCRNLPRDIAIALQIMEWVTLGKPMIQEQPGKAKSVML
jgi:hypothetical protein